MTTPPQLDLACRWLTGRLRPRMVLMGRSIAAYQVCGVAGLLSAIGLTVALALRRGLELSVIAVLLAGAIVTFFALVLATKIIAGRETLVYYQHEIAVLAQAAFLTRLLARPVLSYLDVSAIAIGCFLAFGRIGCLMAGCCHGLPAGTGIRYRHAHADEGFPRDFVGVLLVPIQAIESAWVFLVVLACAVWMARGSRPGDAFASYIVAYGAGRFLLEYWRGDSSRPYRLGSSSAQWISLASAALVMRAELAGSLPFHFWHAAVTASLACLVVWNRLCDRKAHRLFTARHIAEIAGGLSRLAVPNPDLPGIPVVRTSLGVGISHGHLITASGDTHHYTYSRQGSALSSEQAGDLAVLTRRLRGHSQPCLLSQGATGAWRLVFAGTADDQPAVHAAAGLALSGRPAE